MTDKQASIQDVLNCAEGVREEADLQALLASVVDPDGITRHAVRLGTVSAVELLSTQPLTVGEIAKQFGSLFLTGFTLGVQLARMVDDPAFGQEEVKVPMGVCLCFTSGGNPEHWRYNSECPVHISQEDLPHCPECERSRMDHDHKCSIGARESLMRMDSDNDTR